MKTYRTCKCISEITRNKSLDKKVNTLFKSKNLAKDQSGNIILTSSFPKTLWNTNITRKHNKILKMANIGSMMDPCIN